MDAATHEGGGNDPHLPLFGRQPIDRLEVAQRGLETAGVKFDGAGDVGGDRDGQAGAAAARASPLSAARAASSFA